jgi:aryl-alcohol dehydrogenase-like predicted oxidoreductase
VLAQGQDITPIPGTRKARNLEENAAATDVVLSPAQLAALTELGPAAGDRLSTFARTMVGY